MTHNDLEMVLEWRNSPSIRHHMFNSQIIKISEHLTWFQNALSSQRKSLFIFEKSNVPMGFMQLNGELIKGGICNWGFYLSPSSVKGVGYEMGKVTLNYVFGQLGLYKLVGQVLENNYRSIKFHEKLGFKVEKILCGERRSKESYTETFIKTIEFGILRSEWLDK